MKDPSNFNQDWEKRQEAMVYWYKALLANPREAIYCFNHDYRLFWPFLSTLSGFILDVGGGNGIVRHFLSDAVRYVSVDPSLDWLTIDWTKLIDSFPCLEAPPLFVNGLGEYLPFQRHTFDGVLAFWSLNHTRQPDRVLEEIYGVLRPGGRCLIVLEDMEPKWVDLNYYRGCYEKTGLIGLWSTLKLKFGCHFGNGKWPLEDDHIRIQEKELRGWAKKNFTIKRREWVHQYLFFELISI